MSQTITIPTWKLALVVLLAGASGGATVDFLTHQSANSLESHAVYNYLVDTKASVALKERFTEVNNQWPPSKRELADIMLLAVTENAEKK